MIWFAGFETRLAIVAVVSVICYVNWRFMVNHLSCGLDIDDEDRIVAAIMCIPMLIIETLVIFGLVELSYWLFTGSSL